MHATTAIQRLRRIAATGCGIVAAGYLLTGSGIVELSADQVPGAIPPLLIAAALFIALAVAVLARPLRF